jgi:hypothetical protein
MADIGKILDGDVDEYVALLNEAWLEYSRSVQKHWKALYQGYYFPYHSVSLESVSALLLLLLVSPFAVLGFVITILNDTLGFIGNLRTILSKIIAKDVILATFPVPKKSNQRVVTLDVAYRMVAAEMVDSLLTVFSGQSAWTYLTHIKKTTLFWLKVVNFLKTLDKASGMAVVESLFWKTVKAALGALLLVVGQFVALLMLLNFAAKIQSENSQLNDSVLALTNKNPFVVRKQRHRVRDNPKLATR